MPGRRQAAPAGPERRGAEPLGLRSGALGRPRGFGGHRAAHPNAFGEPGAAHPNAFGEPGAARPNAFGGHGGSASQRFWGARGSPSQRFAFRERNPVVTPGAQRPVPSPHGRCRYPEVNTTHSGSTCTCHLVSPRTGRRVLTPWTCGTRDSTRHVARIGLGDPAAAVRAASVVTCAERAGPPSGVPAQECTAGALSLRHGARLLCRATPQACCVSPSGPPAGACPRSCRLRTSPCQHGAFCLLRALPGARLRASFSSPFHVGVRVRACELTGADRG